jgi:hypothetical protein
MKYLLSFLALAMLLLAVPTFAQDQGTGPSVSPKIEDMDVQQFLSYQKMLRQQNTKSLPLENLTPENVNKYAQMGKGLGIAINEGLGAVTKNVEQFAQTSAGKWLMVLITWKVMGNDAVGLARTAAQFAVGGTLLVLGVPFFIYIYRRNCVAYPLLKSKTKVGFLTIKEEYAGVNDPIHDDAGPWGYAVSFVIFVGICAAIMFIH